MPLNTFTYGPENTELIDPARVDLSGKLDKKFWDPVKELKEKYKNAFNTSAQNTNKEESLKEAITLRDEALDKFQSHEKLNRETGNAIDDYSGEPWSLHLMVYFMECALEYVTAHRENREENIAIYQAALQNLRKRFQDIDDINPRISNKAFLLEENILEETMKECAQTLKDTQPKPEL